ncbi:Protein of uncharacterised function (DUF3592) [Legionella beliardensis]|uniref:Protein of uncharacterized function (DUF3592) n=1 Tax=Legionella beliardensis TaxID=91822 RepID=A0A378HZB9_9GAMM|nr:Protein of uncharacterised function (DUF3592) [Legionella beliardensis]
MLSEFLSWQNIADMAWLLLLLLLLKHFWQDRQNLLKAHAWFLTKGRITRFLWTKDGYHLWPKIEYTYQVYDRDFLGEYFFLDTSHNNPNSKYSRRVAYRAAMAFEKNEDIDVFYNPSDPRQAVLDVRIPTKLNFIIFLLVCLIVVHLGVVLYRFL